MPDFVVKQLILRALAYGATKNFVPQDRLIVGVSYRAGAGEKYRLLAKNGVPLASAEEKGDYVEAGGSSSTGEFVTILSLLFAEESKTEFKAVGTDTLRGRRTIIYEYAVKLPDSKHRLSYSGDREGAPATRSSSARAVASGSTARTRASSASSRWRPTSPRPSPSRPRPTPSITSGSTSPARANTSCPPAPSWT